LRVRREWQSCNAGNYRNEASLAHRSIPLPGITTA
jgi:hypothetical protein